MKVSNLYTFQINSVHRNLALLLKNLLKNGVVVLEDLLGEKQDSDHSNSTMTFYEKEYRDFGVKYKVFVEHEKDQNCKVPTKTTLYVFLPGWDLIRKQASIVLQNTYGTAYWPLDEACRAEWDGFNFAVSVDKIQNFFSTVDAGILSLAKIRVLAMGAPISNALASLEVKTSNNDNRNRSYIPSSHPLVTSQTKCGICHCFSTQEKVLIVFSVHFEDDMERALARLFLQQFVGAQKQVAQSPHCDYRRSNHPPKELLQLTKESDRMGSVSTIQKNCAGYLLFTFFPSHIRTFERREKAVELMVNFLLYLDKHVKGSKTYMHTRMREKKYDLLRKLQQHSSSQKRHNVGVYEKNWTVHQHSPLQK